MLQLKHIWNWDVLLLMSSYILFLQNILLIYVSERSGIDFLLVSFCLKSKRLISVSHQHLISPNCVSVQIYYRIIYIFFLSFSWRLKFLQSEFRGQLPKPFSDLPNATKIIPTDMNDLNLEEKTRYVS